MLLVGKFAYLLDALSFRVIPVEAFLLTASEQSSRHSPSRFGANSIVAYIVIVIAQCSLNNF